MILYPSLDIYNGKVVRLEQGNFRKLTNFTGSAETWIKRFEDAGSKDLHIVDLSGARDPSEAQTKIICKLVRSTRMKVQVGGGIRSQAQVEKYLDNGARRVVLGSLAVNSPEILEKILSSLSPVNLCISLDVSFLNDQPVVMTRGWSEASGLILSDVLKNLNSMGLNRFLCTDISKDGMLQGPGFSLYEKLMSQFPELEFQASGGVANLHDLQRLLKLGLHSVILGRSLLTEKIKLREIF